MKATELPQRADRLAEFYITRVNWLISQGREDLIDAIADEYELRLDKRRASTACCPTNASASALATHAPLA